MKIASAVGSERCLLAIVDLQERLLPAIDRQHHVLETAVFLAKAASILGVPGLISEQYPKGLGSTVAEILAVSDEFHRFEKMQFSAGSKIINWLKEHNRLPHGGDQDLEQNSWKTALTGEQSVVVGEAATASEFTQTEAGTAKSIDQIVLIGIESHICIQQTALELIDFGLQVFVASDAISSRNQEDHRVALQRLGTAGCVVTTAESLVFEWCQTAENAAFRSISQLVRQRDANRRPQP